MRVIVQKYGGSSVGTVDKLRQVAAKVIRTKQQGFAVVVVVSAMGRATDALVDLAREVGSNSSARELDVLLATGETASSALLALAIRSHGEEAVSLSASQCGIITNDVHSNARILEIRPQRIKEELARGAIVVVPGFQGMTHGNEITTLGRGGSDTTAVALTAALGAGSCVIYTDVEGVYSADPRIVPNAVRFEEVGTTEMEELAWHGAQVLKAEAVEFAGANGVAVTVRSTFKDESCTVVHPADNPDAYRPRRSEVAGVTGRKDLVRISIRGDGAGNLRREEIFSAISKYDLLFGSLGSPGEPGDLFISNEEIPDPEALANELEVRFDGGIKIAGGLGAVTLVGFGLGSKPEALLSALKVLETQRVPMIKSFSSRQSFSFIIPRSEVDESVRELHRVFVEECRPAHRAAP